MVVPRTLQQRLVSPGHGEHLGVEHPPAQRGGDGVGFQVDGPLVVTVAHAASLQAWWWWWWCGDGVCVCVCVCVCV